MGNSNKLKLMAIEVLFLKFCGFLYFLYGLIHVIRNRGFPGFIADVVLSSFFYVIFISVFLGGLYLLILALVDEYSAPICYIGPGMIAISTIGELFVFNYMLKIPVSVKVLIIVCIVLLIQVVFMLIQKKK